jgi:hypothetical protein
MGSLQARDALVIAEQADHVKPFATCGSIPSFPLFL